MTYAARRFLEKLKREWKNYDSKNEVADAINIQRSSNVPDKMFALEQLKNRYMALRDKASPDVVLRIEELIKKTEEKIKGL